MTAKNNRQGWIWLFGLVWDAALLCLAYAGIVGCLLYTAQIGPNWTLSVYIVGGVGLLLLLCALGLTAFMVLLRLQRTQDYIIVMNNHLRRMVTGQTATEAVLTQICENLLLSDSIKSVAFREKDRELIADAIRQDMRQEKWESAAQLVEILDQRFGCKELAQQLTDEMQKLRQLTLKEKIDVAIAHVESLWLIHRYDDAAKEAELLIKAYPQEKRVQGLKEATLEHLRNHKRQLLSRMEQAVRENDVEEGVEILKLLDSFLTPTEAAALKESARGVFRAKLQQMGVQFSLLVTEKKWHEAVKLGKEIIREYPNSRMAEEVQSKMNILQQRADQEE